MKGTTIKDIVVRAQKADVAAYGELYDMFFTQVYRFVYFRVGNREDAEDLTEQIFVKVFQKISTYQERGVPFEAWLLRIARNHVIDYWRTKREHLSLEKGVGEPDCRPTPEEEALGRIAYQEVLAAVQKLPETYQEIVILKFIEERDTHEIATILDKPDDQVRVLASRAIIKLRELLKKL